jgi:hypothetical protein
MPTKTLKNKKSGSRVILFHGSPVPIVVAENTKRGITYKLPANLLQPKELLKAKLKNKANAAKLAEETRRSKAIEAERAKKERLESQARFAAMLRAQRDTQPTMLLKAFENNNEDSRRKPRTIPPNLLRIMRGESPTPPSKPLTSSNLVSLLGNLSGNRTFRKANLLRLERTASKGKPLGKFWKKEGTNNSNSE